MESVQGNGYKTVHGPVGEGWIIAIGNDEGDLRPTHESGFRWEISLTPQ